jgi:hypothetical protein
MAEQSSESTPVTTPAETPQATPAASPVAKSPGTSKVGAAERRAAAFAELPADMGAVDREPPPMSEGEEAESTPKPDELKVEAKADDKPKEELTPQLAQAAREDARLRRERDSLKSEREALAKEREQWDAGKAEREKPAVDVAKIHRMVAADIVEYADQQKWTAKQRYDMAQALGWSSQPEDKRPAGWRGNGQGQVLSEVEQVRAEAQRVAKELEEFKANAAKEREQYENHQRTEALGHEVLKAMPADASLKYAKGFAEAQPDVARRELAMLTQEMIDAERKAADDDYRKPTPITAADVLKEYDKRWQSHLEERYGWAFKLREPATPAPQAKPANKPNILPASATASPATGRNGKLTAEERRRQAMEVLPEKLT